MAWRTSDIVLGSRADSAMRVSTAAELSTSGQGARVNTAFPRMGWPEMLAIKTDYYSFKSRATSYPLLILTFRFVN